MSTRALCLGVEKRLRTALKDEEGHWIGHQPDGEPPHVYGDKYIAIHSAGSRTNSQDALVDDRMYDISLTVSYKLAYVPNDRRAVEIAREGQAYLEDLADQLPGYLIGDWTTLGDADSFIPGVHDTTNGFIEPFKSATTGDIQIGAGEGDNPATVLRIVVTVRGARRIRLLGTVA